MRERLTKNTFVFRAKEIHGEETSQKEKDEYALEAGKLITEELLHNTKDNAGLL